MPADIIKFIYTPRILYGLNNIFLCIFMNDYFFKYCCLLTSLLPQVSRIFSWHLLLEWRHLISWLSKPSVSDALKISTSSDHPHWTWASNIPFPDWYLHAYVSGLNMPHTKLLIVFHQAYSFHSFPYLMNGYIIPQGAHPKSLGHLYTTSLLSYQK